MPPPKKIPIQRNGRSDSVTIAQVTHRSAAWAFCPRSLRPKTSCCSWPGGCHRFIAGFSLGTEGGRRGKNVFVFVIWIDSGRKCSSHGCWVQKTLVFLWPRKVIRLGSNPCCLASRLSTLSKITVFFLKQGQVVHRRSWHGA